jgi:hypothetical protein
MSNMNVCISFDPVTRFRCEEYAKQQGSSLSAAIRDLVKIGWDSVMRDAAEKAGFPPKVRG